MRKTISMPARNSKPFPKPMPGSSQQKSWSHQQELTALRGKRIKILLRDGEFVQGVLEEADQFSLKVLEDVSLFSLVINKSAMTYFRELA